MISLSSRAWIESQLRLELEAAKEHLLNSNPCERPEARERFKAALRRFSALVLHGEAPADWIGSGW
jgi:hypothetical protein